MVLVFILMIFYEGAKLLRAFLQRGQITEGLFTEGPKNWGAFLQYDRIENPGERGIFLKIPWGFRGILYYKNWQFFIKYDPLQALYSLKNMGIFYFCLKSDILIIVEISSWNGICSGIVYYTANFFPFTYLVYNTIPWFNTIIGNNLVHGMYF